MRDYRLIFRARGKPSEAIRFSAGSPDRALIIAQSRSGPAELWAGDDYVTTLFLADGGFWTLYREPEVVSRCKYARAAQNAPQPPEKGALALSAKVAASPAWSHH